MAPRQAQSLVGRQPSGGMFVRTHVKLRLSRLLVPACTKGQPMVCEKLEGWRGSSFPRPLPGARSPFGDVFGRCLATSKFSASFRRLGRRASASQDRPTPGFQHRNWQRRERRMAWPKLAGLPSPPMQQDDPSPLNRQETPSLLRRWSPQVSSSNMPSDLPIKPCANAWPTVPLPRANSRANIDKWGR